MTCICDELRGVVCAWHRQRQREVLAEPVPPVLPADLYNAELYDGLPEGGEP